MNDALTSACRRVELILSDVDGVMTDGGVLWEPNGESSAKFHIRDGLGIHLWRRTGRQFGIVTGRNVPVVARHAAALGLDFVRQDAEPKMTAVVEILAQTGLQANQLCYIGDDLPDLAVVRAAGLGVAVADAVGELRDAADYTTAASGGHGAVREVVELILKSGGQWAEAMALYTGE